MGGWGQELLRHRFSTALVGPGMTPELLGSENCLLSGSWDRKSPRSHSHEIPCNLPQSEVTWSSLLLFKSFSFYEKSSLKSFTSTFRKLLN